MGDDMDLRNHPLMCYRGVRNWPPVWTHVEKENVRTLRGEIGVLTYVLSQGRLSNKCYLVIDKNGERYVGCLIFDDPPFCAQIATLLKSHVGHLVKKIGDIEVGSML